MWGLNDLKLPEHVLVERVVDVQLHPVQTRNALRKVLGKVSKQAHGIGLLHLRHHFSNHGVGSASLFCIVRRTNGFVSVSQALGKKSEVE